MHMAFYISLYITAPLIFCLVRKIYLNKALMSGEKFFEVKPIMKHLQIRIILYVLIIITQYRFYNTLTEIRMHLTILTFILITELYLLLTNRLTRIIFYNNAIIVGGTDFRIDLPLNDNMQNTTGIYAYSDCESGKLKNQVLTLEMQYKRGTLSLLLPEDKIPHITAFIESKGIRVNRL